MKKLISKVLIRFITKYKLYALIQDGENKYLEIKDMPLLFPKDDKWHTVAITYSVKLNKMQATLDDIAVFNKSVV